MDSTLETPPIPRPINIAPPATAFVELYEIRSYECDSDGFAQFPTICNLLQETAANHARALGLAAGGHAMPDNLTWVLTRLRVELSRYPSWRDCVNVLTFPRGMRKLFAYRDFEISLADGSALGRASSEWMVINPQTRRAERIPETVAAIANTVRAPALGEMPFSKIEHPDVPPAAEASFVAQRSHIDTNGHVNNVRYIEWMLETAEEKAKRPLSFEAVFRSEVLAGGAVDVQRAQSGGFASFRLSSCGKESVVARAR